MKRVTLSDLNLFEKRKRVKFINCLSGFKSANLIGTTSSEGNTNLSIVSSAFHLGADPALMGFVIRPSSSPRHTLNNLRQTNVCTLNHINEDIFQKAHQTSARYPQEVSEFDSCGLTEQYLNDFKAPYVAESHIKVGLELVREELIKENNTHLMILSITNVYFPETDLRDDGSLDIQSSGTICVSGLDSYHSTENKGRLSYAKTDHSPYFI